MKKILVPVDFSEYAENAFVYALRLADTLAAEIHLLYVILPSSIDSSPFLIKPYAELLKGAKGRMQHFYHNGINIASPLLENRPQVRTSVRGGDLKEVIKDTIKSMECDLMVLGTKGRFDEWSSVFGSTTAHLISKVDCPVLIIPTAAKYQPLKSVVFGCEDESQLPTEAVDNIGWIYEPNAPTTHFVHVSPDASSETSQGDEGVATATVAIISSPNVVEGLLTYAERSNATLLAMKRNKKSWFDKLFSKSYTRQAVLDAEIQLLVY